jgi:tyrosine-protein kinase Etk/Wzc
MNSQEKSLHYYWDVIVRRHVLLAGVFFGVTALVFFAGSRQRPQYQSSASLLVTQDGSAADPMSLFSSATGMAKRPILVNHIEVLKSYTIARMVFDTLPAEVQEQVRAGAKGDPVLWLMRSLSVRPVRDADIIRLSVTAGTAEMSRTLAAAYVDAYRTFNLERSRADVSAVREFVGAQLGVVGARLDSTERKLQDYKQSHRVSDITEETKATVERQTDVLSFLEQTRAERAGVEHQVSFLTGKADSSGLDNTSSPLVSDLRGELARLEAERTNLLVQGFDATSPRVKALAERVGAVKQELGREVGRFVSAAGAVDGAQRVSALYSRLSELEPEQERLRASEVVLAAAAEQYESELSALPVRERALARLTRDVDVDRQVHMLLSQRYEEARIQEAGRLSTVGLVDAPRPGVRVKPNHKTDAMMALLLGLLLALGAVFGMDYFDTTVRRPEDLERQGFSVLASVPRIEEPSRKPQAASPGPGVGSLELEAGGRTGPISSREPGSAAAEAFRVLRTNIQFAVGNSGQTIAARTLMVTSPGAGEGKSTVASNLATVLAQSGKRTLLVDADLRKPKQHKVFGLRKKPGLTDVVMLGAQLEAALHDAGSTLDAARITPDTQEHDAASTGHSASGKLHVLFAGTTPPSPVDFLNSAAFAEFLERVQGLYDCVVVDTPPVLVSADAAVLASKVGGVALVARMKTTDWRALAESKRLLAQAGAKVLGVLANELTVSRGYGYYRYKYRYYHYRYQQTAAS